MSDRRHNPILGNMLVIGMSLLFSVAIIGTFLPASQKTADDLEHLYNHLEAGQGRRVLGANNITQTENYGCPQDKPVVGWIDWRGDKKIKDNLPKGQTASACFKSIEEAQAEGFEVE